MLKSLKKFIGSLRKGNNNWKGAWKGATPMMMRIVDCRMKVFKRTYNVSIMKKELHDGLNPIELDMSIGGLSPMASNEE